MADFSKFEKEILSYLQEQSISAQILQNLTSDKVDELREQTDLLKDARSFQAESVKDLKEKLGLGDVMNDKQRKLAFISSKINILQQDKNKELHKEQIQQLQLGQSAIKNSLAIDQAGEAIELIVGGFANIVSSARKFSVIVSGVGLAALWVAPLIIVVGLLSMAVSKFIHLDRVAESVRKTTGLMKSQTEALPGIIASTQKRFAFLGITMEDVGEIFTEIKSEFTDALSVSQAMVDTVSVLNKNFGIGVSEATKFFLIVRSISGESTETAVGLAEWVISISRINKIAPQKIFEEGLVTIKDGNNIKDIHRIAGVSAHTNADYTEARQVLDSLLTAFGVDYKVVETEHPSFIPGRVGRVVVNGKKVAYVGELAPEVVKNFELNVPVCGFELNLTELFSVIS